MDGQENLSALPIERTTSFNSTAMSPSPLVRGRSTDFGIKRTTSMNMKTPGGFCIPCTVPVEVKELQCAACNQLVEKPYHAPCGHSFCQSHLGLDDNSRDDLGDAAALLRRLCIDKGFSFARAREALALSPKDTQRAEQMCIQAAGLEGRAVRIRPDVKDPQFGWGLVTPSSIGRVARQEDGHVHVDFPTQKRWHGLADELEIEETSDQIRADAIVRVRQGIQPVNGWGALEGDKTGRVLEVSQAAVLVQCDCNIWSGFVGELEAVSTPEDAAGDVEKLAAAVKRLRLSSPKDSCRAALVSVLKTAAEASSNVCRTMLRGERRALIMRTTGAMDVLRIAGFEAVKWDVFRSRVLIESTMEGFSGKAQQVLAAMETEFGPAPAVDFSEDNKRYDVSITIDKPRQKRDDWDDFWKELQPKLIAALQPPGAGWTWRRKGWENEETLKEHVKEKMILGPVPIARGQSQRESKQISCSLEAAGIKVHVKEIESVKDDDVTPALGDDPIEISPMLTWEGPIKEGSRVRLVNVEADKYPKDVTAASIGVVNGQYTHSESGLQFLVSFPGALNQHINAANAEVVEEADLIQPGVRVKASSEPQFGWQGVESTDIGVVHSIRFDGTVRVYIPWIENLFRATIGDLDTKDLPKVAQGDCPVCHEPLLAGELLAIDMVLEDQRKRLMGLMSGSKTEKNDALGGGASGDKTPKLVRTNTHKEGLTCMICLDLMVSPVTLGCGHSFCKAHIEAWLLENPRCPKCRHRVLPERLKRRQGQAHRQRLFDVELEDHGVHATGEDGVAVQTNTEDWPEIPVNKMLETQLVRHFAKDFQERKSEVAAEVWGELQSRSRGYLSKLRNFLRQFDLEGVQQLISSGYTDLDMQLPGTHGGTLLMLLSELGLSACVKDMLGRGADPVKVATSVEDVGATALSLAAAQGHEETLQVLLDATEWTAMRLADALAAGIEQGCTECAKTLLKYQSGLAGLQNSFGFPAILTAVQTNNTEVIPILLDNGAQLDSSLSTGLLACGASASAANGVYQTVGEHGGKPYYQNTNGAVIFFNDWWKIAGKRSDMGLRHLYSMPEPRRDTSEPPVGEWTLHGSDGSHESFTPTSPTLEKLDGEQGTGLTPLLLAVQLGSVETASLLLELKADPCTQVPKTQEYVLQVACSGGDLTMVRTLMEFKASPSSVDKLGHTPLWSASQAGHHLLAKELIGAAASPDTEQLPTPLMMAVCLGTYPPLPGKSATGTKSKKFGLVVTELLAANAKVDFRDADGSSILHLAARSGASEEVINALIGAGAVPEVTDAEGRTPFFTALLSGRNAAACALVQHCGKWDDSLGAEYENLLPLSAAALLGDLELVNRFIKIFQEGGDITKWLQSASQWHSKSGGQCIRLTCEGLEKHCWQILQEPALPYPIDEGADPENLEVGDWVVVGPNYMAQGHAAKGPLKLGDVGRIIKKDKGKVPFQVQTGSHTFWYRDGALVKYRATTTSEKITEWKGHLSHPFLGGDKTLKVQMQLKTETTGQLTVVDESKDFTLTRNGADFRLCEEGGTLELVGKMDERGCVQGKVVKDGFRSSLPERGNFTLIPASQDATVRCPRGHPCERMSPFTWRPCTCDVCRKSIEMTEPFSFCCRQCNYDVCKSCCGAQLWARLPPERHINMAGLSPLHVAAATGHGDIVEALLAAKADPLGKDVHGRTPLHWAASCGHGWVLENLLKYAIANLPPESLTAVEDVHGHIPVSLASEELMRFVTGEGEGLHGNFVEVDRPGDSGPSGVSGIYRAQGKRNDRPIYIRRDGPGWAIYWDSNAKRWGLYRERYEAAFLQYQSKVDTPSCPKTGWELAVARDPLPVFKDVLPWRAGGALLEATPASLRPKPHVLRQIVQALPPLASTEAGVLNINLGELGTDARSFQTYLQALDALIQEMVRRGDLPSEAPPGCLQQ